MYLHLAKNNNLLFKRIYFWYAVLIFCIVFLLFFPAFLLTAYLDKMQPITQRLRKAAIRVFLVFTGLFYTVKNKEKRIKGSQFIVCANHASHLDTVLVAAAIPGFFRFLAKAELLKIPLFGMFFRTIDIPVERASVEGGKKALKQAEECIKNGDSLIFYPEGGIKEGSPILQPFKSGAFILAQKYNVPILPLTLLKTWERLPDLASYGTPGPMQVIVHDPIVPSNMKDKSIDALKQKVFDTINKPLKAYLNANDV